MRSIQYLRDRLGSAGDTIVEVLIAIAVLSLVLGGAYVVSNHSLQGVRLGQEHTDALKIAESQVELLRSLSAGSTVDIYDTSGTALYCIDDTPARHNFSMSDLPALDDDQFSAYPDECENVNHFYNLSVLYEPAKNDLFTVRVRWEGPSRARQQTLLEYRLPKNGSGSSSSTPTPPSPPAPPAPPSPPPSPVPVGCIITPNVVNIPEIIPSGSPISISHLYYSGHLEYNLDISSATAGMTNNCKLKILVTTRDPGHPGAGTQPNERLYIRFTLADGSTLDTGLTQDLPDGLLTTVTDVGTFTFSSRPTNANFRHYNLWPGTVDGGPNSIDPAAIQFIAVP